MSDTPGVVSTWLLTFVTPIGELSPVVTLNADGTGSAVLDLGTVEIFDAVQDGNSLTFSAKVVMPMGEFELALAGTIEGDELSGTLKGSMGSFPVTGARLS